jgi:hypothetical protein
MASVDWEKWCSICGNSQSAHINIENEEMVDFLMEYCNVRFNVNTIICNLILLFVLF